jgi:hypothetical protein
MPIEHAKEHSELGSVMGCVKHPAPEYPDALALNIEKWNGFHPPDLLL